MQLVLTVDPRAPRDRLDKCLVALLAAAGRKVSRAEAQRWIEAGRVSVDGARGASASSVKLGALITATPLPPPLSEAIADASVKVVVVYEDRHLLVVDKPAGLVVHPARGHESGTLVNGLLARTASLAAADQRDTQGRVRPGIVHRLDKGTSGLLVVAKDAETREGLKGLFQTHDIEREYVAIVVGAARERTIATLHGRHPTERLRFTSRGHIAHGKQATTHVRVLEALHGATLVACTLETGRTHQIRVHLAEQMGTPVLGDPLYGSSPRDATLLRLARELGHQALHARLLGFVHPMTGKTMRFESPMPPDLKRILTLLRSL